MPERKMELRKAAIKRHRKRKQMKTRPRECEDCGAAIKPNDQGYDAVLCWDCLNLINGNTQAARPRRRRSSGGDAA